MLKIAPVYWKMLVNVVGRLMARPEVRRAFSNLASNHGPDAVAGAFRALKGTQHGQSILSNGSTTEIMEAIKEILKKAANGLADEAFEATNKLIAKQERSGAKKLAQILNKQIDYIEDKTKKGIIKSYANANNRKLADTLKVLSKPGVGKPGVEGIDVLGIEVNGKYIEGKVRGKAYNAARDILLEGLRASIVPKTKAEAFAVSYVRGLLGEATSSAASSVLTGIPQTILGAPRGRAFVNTLRSEISHLGTVGQAKNAAQISKAFRNALGDARDVYGSQEGLVSSQIAGYVSGRLTLPIAGTYVFVDGDQRKENFEKLQNSIAPFAKQEAQTFISEYTKSDGTKVQSHYRTAN
jgi:hypothetical protein